MTVSLEAGPARVVVAAVGEDWGAALLTTAATLAVLTLVEFVAGMLLFAI